MANVICCNKQNNKNNIIKDLFSSLCTKFLWLFLFDAGDCIKEKEYGFELYEWTFRAKKKKTDIYIEKLLKKKKIEQEEQEGGFAGYDIENNLATRQATSFSTTIYNYDQGFLFFGFFSALLCSFLEQLGMRMRRLRNWTRKEVFFFSLVSNLVA